MDTLPTGPVLGPNRADSSRHRALFRRTAALVPVVVLVNGFALAVLTYSLHSSRVQAQERAAAASQTTVRLLERDLEGTFKQVDLALLTVKLEAERRLAAGPQAQAGLDPFIQNLFTKVPYLDAMRTTDAQGDIQHGIRHDPKVRINLADREYFRHLKADPHAGLVISSPLLSRVDGRWVIILARRLDASDGSFAGIAYANIALTQFDRALSLVDPGPRGTLALLGPDFSLIASQPPFGPSGSKGWVFPEIEIKVRSGQARGTFTSHSNADGLLRTVSFDTLGQHPFYVVTGLAAADYMAAWRKEALQGALLMGLFLVVTLSAGYLIRSYWRRETQARFRVLLDKAKAALYQVSEAAQAAPGLQDLFRRIHAIIGELLPATNFYVALYDEGADQISFPYFVDEKDLAPPLRKPGKGLTDLVLRKGEPVLLSREDLGELVARDEVRITGTWPVDWLGVPLVVHKHAIGILAVQTYTVDVRFTHQDMELLQFVCTQVASSIERKRAEEERHRLETELNHIQKLESIGNLAGGVAHDMNNVLGAILGVASFLQEQHEGDPALLRSLDTILRAAGRGRDLVKNLTDFARKGLEEPTAMDLNEAVAREVELLRHTTLQMVEFREELEPDLPKVLGDPSVIGNCLMNLAMNAIDAMPSGGLLTFRSRAAGGRWVELTVQDNGKGMPPEVLAKAMEPFFTTKPVGKGTGMGLPRVFGAMRAHGGTVELASEVGKGTTVLLRFPVFAG